MSLTTRCPACGTMFKVVPDQLRISEGWVRCGHCADVFDANARLQEDEEDAGVTAPIELAASRAVPAAPSKRQPDPGPESEAFASSSLITEIGDEPHSEGPDSAQLEAEAQALAEHPLDRPFELRRADAGEVTAPRMGRPPRVQPAAKPEPEPELEPELQDLSFVRDAQRKAFWRRRPVRTMLVLASIGLGLLLAGQVAVHDRDRLAATNPGLRPLLSQLCRALDCVVQPPRQIDAIAIDSSSFSRLGGDAYRVNVTLKNQAAMDLAMPALELTLTDGQDQAVVRRVIMPSELGPHPGVIAAASEWSTSFALAVVSDANSSRIAGYRLLAFYP